MIDRFKKNYIFILLAIGLFLRLYNLNNSFTFSMDEEYQATYAATIVEDPHPIWIGVSQADTGFYLGPYMTYLTAILLAISKGDPTITGYFSSFLGIFTAFSLYWFVSKIYDKRHGILAASMYLLSPLIIYFDQRFWNPTLLPLLSIVIFGSFILALKNPRWLLLTIFAYGISFHSHLSIIPIALIFFLYPFLSKKKVSLKLSLGLIIAFIIAIWPLIVFDLNHDYSNIKTPIRMIQNHSKNLSLDKSDNLSAWGNFLGRLFHLDFASSNFIETRWSCSEFQTQGGAFSIVLLVIMVLFFIKLNKNSQKKDKILALMIVIFSLSFIFYPGKVYEYYLLGLAPLLFIMISRVLIGSSISNKKIIILITALSLLSAVTITKNDDSYGIGSKKNLINNASGFLSGSSYYLQEEGGCLKSGGWRYLFKTFGQLPTASSSDNAFGWLYPSEVGDKNKVENKVIISDVEEDQSRYEKIGKYYYQIISKENK